MEGPEYNLKTPESIATAIKDVFLTEEKRRYNSELVAEEARPVVDTLTLSQEARDLITEQRIQKLLAMLPDDASCKKALKAGMLLAQEFWDYQLEVNNNDKVRRLAEKRLQEIKAAIEQLDKPKNQKPASNP